MRHRMYDVMTCDWTSGASWVVLGLEMMVTVVITVEDGEADGCNDGWV